MSSLPEDPFRAVQQDAEEYQSTVHALIAFSAYVVHTGSEFRPDAHFGFGRRMSTSEGNAVLPSDEVTPDLVAQKDSSFGIVAEVKRSASRHESDCSKHLAQLRKYDDDLAGWWTDTEQIPLRNAAIIIHQSRSRRLVEELRSTAASDPEGVGENSLVIEFNLSNEVDPYIFFRVEWGEVRDPELRPRLHAGVPVPRDKVLASFPSIKFYDAEPPLAWLMTLLWTDYFAANWDTESYDTDLKAYPIIVSVESLTAELQKAYGSAALERDERSAEFPQQKWIRRALDAFVSIHYAVPLGETGEYQVLFRPIAGDVLERFAELLRPKPIDPAPLNQLDLDFED